MHFSSQRFGECVTHILCRPVPSSSEGLPAVLVAVPTSNESAHCLRRPTNPRREPTANPLDESVRTTTSAHMPKSESMDLAPKPIAAHLTIP